MFRRSKDCAGEAKRGKIVGIHERDAWYPDRDRILGTEGDYLPVIETLDGYWSIDFFPDDEKLITDIFPLDEDGYFCFFAVKVEPMG